MNDNSTVEGGSSLESGAEYQPHINKHVVVTVLMRRKEFERLKKRGGPRPDQISMALRHYLKLVAETKWHPEMSDAATKTWSFATFQCAISKDLWNDIRKLGGRPDSHTVEAIRLFLL